MTEECDVRPCDDKSPCLNEAACSLSDHDEYQCQCAHGYAGSFLTTFYHNTVSLCAIRTTLGLPIG